MKMFERELKQKTNRSLINHCYLNKKSILLSFLSLLFITKYDLIGITKNVKASQKTL